MFFIDKYKPSNKENSEFHNDILNMLEIMSKDHAIPHIIFYGPNGSGKKTMINIFLEMLFNKNIHNTKEVPYEIVSSGGKKTFEKIKQSNYHIEINPKGTNYDRYLIHDIVKEYAKSKSLNMIFENNKQFKLVLINNVDNMSNDAQLSLRRTMEVYSDKCRFIMWCESLSKIIKELQSRCIKIRVMSPTNDEIFMYIFKIAMKENIDIRLNKLSDIVIKANGNIKHALWDLQFLKYGYEYVTEYSKTINNIIELIIDGKLDNIKLIKELLFHLMITNFSGSIILRDILNCICLSNNKKFNDNNKQKIISKGAEIEYRLIKKRREIIHFTSFILFAINEIQ